MLQMNDRSFKWVNVWQGNFRYCIIATLHEIVIGLRCVRANIAAMNMTESFILPREH